MVSISIYSGLLLSVCQILLAEPCAPHNGPQQSESAEFKIVQSNVLQVVLESSANMLDDVDGVQSSSIASGCVQRPLAISGSRGVAIHLLGSRRICIYDIEEPG